MINKARLSNGSTLMCSVYEDPKRSHELTVRQIDKYLLGTKNKVIIFKPDHTKGLECYVDEAFAVGWQ